jgi:hypothetical protein
MRLRLRLPPPAAEDDKEPVALANDPRRDDARVEDEEDEVASGALAAPSAKKAKLRTAASTRAASASLSSEGASLLGAADEEAILGMAKKRVLVMRGRGGSRESGWIRWTIISHQSWDLRPFTYLFLEHLFWVHKLPAVIARGAHTGLSRLSTLSLQSS